MRKAMDIEYIPFTIPKKLDLVRTKKMLYQLANKLNNEQIGMEEFLQQSVIVMENTSKPEYRNIDNVDDLIQKAIADKECRCKVQFRKYEGLDKLFRQIAPEKEGDDKH